MAIKLKEKETRIKGRGTIKGITDEKREVGEKDGALEATRLHTSPSIKRQNQHQKRRIEE